MSIKKFSFIILCLLLFLVGCDNINPENNEPGEKFSMQGISIASTKIIDFKSYRISIIDSLLNMNGKKLDLMEKIQKKSKIKIPELEKKIEDLTYTYQRLLEELGRLQMTRISLTKV